MTKWAKYFGHNILMEQWENIKRLKFTLCHNLKENFYKMMYIWYVNKGIQIYVGNVKKKKCCFITVDM